MFSRWMKRQREVERQSQGGVKSSHSPVWMNSLIQFGCKTLDFYIYTERIDMRERRVLKASEKSGPLVSVIMATFNEEPDMIGKSISSIIDQTYENFELLIFDDSTKQETKDKIDSFTTDPRVKVFRFPSRVGFVKSLNKGLEAAKGKYIARMDGDDMSLPIRFEKEVHFLEKHKDIAVVGGQINIMDENNKITSSRSYPLGGMKLYLFSCARNPLAHPTIMMHRSLVDKGFRYDETLKMSEDLDFWLRLLNAGYHIANLPDNVLNYRVQSNFMEKRSSTKQREYMANVRKKNFDSHHLFHSVLSNAFGWMFTHVPVGAINNIYRKENNQ